MSCDSTALRKIPFNVYYFLIALLPGTLLTTYYAGLTRDSIMVFYTDYSAAIKMLVAVATALLIGLITLLIRRLSIISALKDPQLLLIGVLVGLCLPNTLVWWEISSSVAFAILVGRYLLSNHLQPVLVGYVFSLVAFPTSHGLSTILKSELYNAHLLELNSAFVLGGLFLSALKKINWRIPIMLFVVYIVLTLTFEIMIIGTPISRNLINSILTPTTAFGIFFIAPFTVNDNVTSRLSFLIALIVGITLFLLSKYARYPDALLPALLVMNIINWAWVSKNTSLNNMHITSISSHTLLAPILSASIAMVIASSITQAAIVGAIVVVIYLSVQSIIDVIKRYVPPSSVFSLVIVLTAFLSTYIDLSVKVNLPSLSKTIDNALPLLALSSLILSCSHIVTGNHAPFKMLSALKTSVLFFVFVLLIGSLSEFTDANRVFSAGLFFLFALIALYNNPILSSIEPPNNKPNRRVRTTGTIK